MECTIITLFRGDSGETYTTVVDGWLSPEKERELTESLNVDDEDQIGFLRTRSRPVDAFEALDNAFPDQDEDDDDEG